MWRRGRDEEIELEDAPSLRHTVWMSRDRWWAFKTLHAQLETCLRNHTGSHCLWISWQFFTLGRLSWSRFSLATVYLLAPWTWQALGRERERLKPGTQSLAWVSDAQGSPPCMLDSETQTWLPTFHLSQRRSHLSKEKEVYVFLRSLCSGRGMKEPWTQACLTLAFCSSRE